MIEMATQNIAVKLCGILQAQTKEEVTAREWRLIGQEQGGSQVLSWMSTKGNKQLFHVGIYTNKTKTLLPLHTFEEKLNIIQASVNPSLTLLVYVVKVLPSEHSDNQEALYYPYALPLLLGKENHPVAIEECSKRQIMVQYLYGRSYKFSPGVRNDRFLLLKHLECIKIYDTTLVCTDEETDDWSFDGKLPEPETIVKAFSWAQWDCVNQVLYYIYYRAPTQSFAEGEERKSPSEATPTLSALQFHADLPHETVLNIPLSLPQLGAGEGPACGQYEDDPVPLRVHDCSLDLLATADSSANNPALCITHHYLYKPLDSSSSSLTLAEEGDELQCGGVNFAYSITLLQHGCVLHSVVPQLPWALARSLRPSVAFYGDGQLLVTIPNLITHLIDISVSHDACSHVIMPNQSALTSPALAPILGWGPHAMVDLKTLDVVTMNVSDRELVTTFKSNTTLENKLGILHYLIMHVGNMELAEELVSWQVVQGGGSGGGGGAASRGVMREYLSAAAAAATARALPSAARPLLDMLPFTCLDKYADVKIGDMHISVTQEKLWNSSVVVLAPRQRVCQFVEDMWTRLWVKLNPSVKLTRFNHSVLKEKLSHSRGYYQPEALSRCTTPLSPSGGSQWARRCSLPASDALPFHEIDVCTVSKQEHILAVTSSAVSSHLQSHPVGRAHAGGAAGRVLCARGEAARDLCRLLCRALAATPRHRRYGLHYIDELEATHAFLLFKVLEQYYLCCEDLCYPPPQGFTSFFAYLAYRALPFPAFMQRLHRSVVEMQIDVLKHIVATEEDSPENIEKKLRLLTVSGSGRCVRALGAWRHRVAAVLRAREHCAQLLTGGEARTRVAAHTQHLVSASLPSGERISPLDTFLDLLTAKASLHELDFNLIIDATLASMKEDLGV